MEWRGVEVRPTLDHADPQRVQPFGVLWKTGKKVNKCEGGLKGAFGGKMRNQSFIILCNILSLEIKHSFYDLGVIRVFLANEA